MFKVKNDHANEVYVIPDFEVTDKEGEVLPDDAVDVIVESTDPAVAAVSPNPAGGGGEISFGRSGTATINANFKSKASGELLASFSASFLVTAGDPAAVTGGDLKFPGLTEEPA